MGKMMLAIALWLTVVLAAQPNSQLVQVQGIEAQATGARVRGTETQVARRTPTLTETPTPRPTPRAGTPTNTPTL